MKEILRRSLQVIAFFIIHQTLAAQSCGNCVLTISGANNTSYTVNPGQTICLDSTAMYTGNITMNGGTICNKGIFKPQSLNFTSGTISNYGNIKIAGNFLLGSNQTIVSERKAFLKIGGNLTISGGTFTNKGITNVNVTLAYVAGSFTNSGIVNCETLSGVTASNIANTGIINKD